MSQRGRYYTCPKCLKKTITFRLDAEGGGYVAYCRKAPWHKSSCGFEQRVPASVVAERVTKRGMYDYVLEQSSGVSGDGATA